MIIIIIYGVGINYIVNIVLSRHLKINIQLIRGDSLEA